MTASSLEQQSSGLLETLIQTARPEQRLLLLCAQIRMSEEDRGTFTNCAREIRDWDVLIDDSIQHSLLPQLAAYLPENGGEAVPPDVLENVKSRSYQNTARNSFLARKLMEIVELLEQADLPVLPYKGPLLAQALYGDVGMRRFDDLDFLVRGSDIFRVRHLMTERGAVEHPSLTHRQARYYVRAGWSLIYKDPKEDYSVEFDAGLAPRYFAFEMPEEVLWKDTIEVPFEGRKVRTLSWENLLIYLCVHGSKHAWTRLLWILDIAQLIDKQDIDWEIVIDRAKQCGVTRMVSLGLALAHSVGKAHLPETASALTVRDPLIPRLAQQVMSPLATDHPPLSGAETVLFHLLARERLRDRLTYIFRFIFSPTYSDWRAVSLPPPLYFLYYLLRPFRVLWSKMRRDNGSAPNANTAQSSRED